MNIICWKNINFTYELLIHIVICRIFGIPDRIFEESFGQYPVKNIIDKQITITGKTFLDFVREAFGESFHRVDQYIDQILSSSYFSADAIEVTS